MKTKITFAVIAVFFLFFSCKSNFQIEKRKYRPGWFADFSKDNLQRRNIETKNDTVAVVAPMEKTVEKANNNPLQISSVIQKVQLPIVEKIENNILAHPQLHKSIALAFFPIEKSAREFSKQRTKLATGSSNASFENDAAALVFLSLSLLSLIFFLILYSMALTDEAAMAGIMFFFFFLIGFIFAGCPFGDLDLDDD